MKAGIVSLYGTFNYGNRLQSYASQEILRELGFDTEVIYVQPQKEYFREFGKKVYFSKQLRRLLRPGTIAVQKYRRQRAFEEFNSKYIITRRYSAVHQIKDADFFVLGSDQVWNPKRYNAVKKELFFLNFTESKKKVCLSPSFGLSEIPNEWKLYFAEHLLTFPRISVREESGARIVKNLTGKEAEVLVDPTLMIDPQKWRKIERHPWGVNTESDYILNYFLGAVPEKARINSTDVANKTGASIYDLMDASTGNLYTSGPSEFLYLIDHASLVQTDSFHACIFSFLFGKPFLLYAREGKDPDMLSRIETLFNTFDLARKYVGSGSENDLFECDYDTGYRRLLIEREKAIAFLKESMNI